MLELFVRQSVVLMSRQTIKQNPEFIIIRVKSLSLHIKKYYLFILKGQFVVVNKQPGRA